MKNLFITFLGLGVLSQRADALRQDNQIVLENDLAVTDACSVLSKELPDQAFHPEDSTYKDQQSRYWTAQQSSLQPKCRFLPSNARNVRSALLLGMFHNSTNAIVSGGHSSNTGASNINAGLTIDLSALNEITLTEDKSEVWLGPGARWGDVYAALEPHNLTVAGARLSDVGVGGFVLGGGLSWFANQIGWSCDSVTEFEVLALTGLVPPQILHASRTEHADLFWALKGSLGAFGVVTRIKMRTIPNTGIYAGGISFPAHALPEAVDVLSQIAFFADENAYTQGYISFAYIEAIHDFAYTAYIVNTQGENDTAALRNWRSVPHEHSSLRHTTIKDSAEEMSRGNEAGLRRSKFTLTMEVDVNAMLDLHAYIQRFVSGMPSLGEKGLLGVTFQPLTLPMLHHTSCQANLNIFSSAFADVSKPLILVSVEAWWEDENLDRRIESSIRELEKELLKIVETRSIDHPWTYPNYAAAWQRPFDGGRIGEETLERMRKVRDVYDPEGDWERLVPGSWKL